jgi:hypothetical protein
MFDYRFLPLAFVVVFLFGATLRLAATFLFGAAFLDTVFLFGALRFFGAVVAFFFAATVRFLLEAVLAEASAFNFAFLFLVLAALTAAALLCALVCAIMIFLIFTMSYTSAVKYFCLKIPIFIIAKLLEIYF